jgi:hypothetical protein
MLDQAGKRCLCLRGEPARVRRSNAGQSDHAAITKLQEIAGQHTGDRR